MEVGSQIFSLLEVAGSVVDQEQVMLDVDRHQDLDSVMNIQPMDMMEPVNTKFRQP